MEQTESDLLELENLENSDHGIDDDPMKELIKDEQKTLLKSRSEIADQLLKSLLPADGG